jgi:hypothetical protein
VIYIHTYINCGGLGFSFTGSDQTTSFHTSISLLKQCCLVRIVIIYIVVDITNIVRVVIVVGTFTQQPAGWVLF